MIRSVAPAAFLLASLAASPGATRIAHKDQEGFSCARAIRYDGLGALPGPDRALPFGAGLIALPEASERVVAFDPGGGQLFFTVVGPPGPQIMQSLYRDGRWRAPVRAAFSDIGFNTEPSFSPDGRTLFFVSNRPPSKNTDIWKVERSGAGWSAPERLSDAVNGDGYEWHPQATANGDLYFAAEDRKDSLGGADLYRAKFQNGAYAPAQNLGPHINSASVEWDGYVNPSGAYLIFKSDRPGGYGGLDIYLSTRDGEGWSVPRDLGPAINTADDEDTGEVTPDGRFMTFARRKPGTAQWTMYWIDMRAVRPVTSSCRDAGN